MAEDVMLESLNIEEVRKVSFVLAALAGQERRNAFGINVAFREETMEIFGPRVKKAVEEAEHKALAEIDQLRFKGKLYQASINIPDIDASCRVFNRNNIIAPLSYDELALILVLEKLGQCRKPAPVELLR